MDIRLEKLPFEFDGKTFQLCCNMNVLADVQEEYGGEIMAALRGNGVLKSVLVFLSAMLNDYADEQGWSERYTAKQVGRILTSKSELEEASTKVMTLVRASMKDGEPEKNRPTMRSRVTV